MSGPETAAGRELWSHMRNWFDDPSPDLILAIEAEARSAGAARYEAALREIIGHPTNVLLRLQDLVDDLLAAAPPEPGDGLDVERLALRELAEAYGVSRDDSLNRAQLDALRSAVLRYTAPSQPAEESRDE